MNKEKSITENAYDILKNEAKPLHYKKLTELIMKEKRLRGKIPWKTVNACLCTNAKFKHIGEERSGIYGLSEWT